MAFYKRKCEGMVEVVREVLGKMDELKREMESLRNKLDLNVTGGGRSGDIRVGVKELIKRELKEMVNMMEVNREERKEEEELMEVDEGRGVVLRR